MDHTLLDLPFQIQGILAIGYLSYRLATTGLDKRHRTGDFILQVFVYGAMAKLAHELCIQYGFSIIISWTAATIAALLIAGIWRSIGQRIVVSLLRRAKITRENFFPSTWTAIIGTSNCWKYISVRLIDGTYLHSDIDRLPHGLPHEPLDVDPEGNIAMYITGIRKHDTNDDILEESEVLDIFGRAHLTYIPASQISRITVSLATTVTCPSEEEEEVSSRASTSSLDLPNPASSVRD